MTSILQNDESSRVRIAYVKAVRVAFQDNRIKDDQFYELRYELTNHKKHNDEFLNHVKARVKKLFEGHTDLISGFNIFLPKTNIPQNDELSRVRDAYFKAVKVAFQGNRIKHNQFCKLRKELIDHKKHDEEFLNLVKTRVKKLFEGNTDLILGFNIFLPKINIPQNTKTSRVSDDVSVYLKAVEVAFQYDRIKYDLFFELIEDLRSPKKHDDEFLNLIKARVKSLFEGHSNLILGFNIFLPKQHQITPPFQLETTGKKVKKVEENCELPWDVLDIISKTLDFDDLFQFAGVCMNWRVFHKIYWRIFLASQEPLLLQISDYVEKSYSFISIPDQKVYRLEMMKYFLYSNYVSSSGGYFIMSKYNRSLIMLINPFTRKKKVINNVPSDVNNIYLIHRALLAFGKCSEEFVLVILRGRGLHVYQSRNSCWVTYSTMENLGMVVDFVVLNNIIYVITSKANIGVLSLNSANIKFLKMTITPELTCSMYLRLVNCDEQLLVVDFLMSKIKNVYKVDFSTMNYVELETLGNIALFYVSKRDRTNFYALSNPNRWGYEKDSVYNIGISSTICSVYSGDAKRKLQKCITLPTPHVASSPQFEWCFRHLQYEVDYSLVE